MKKLLGFCIFCVHFAAGFAQTNISFRIPNSSMMNKEQLLNCIVTSSGNYDQVNFIGTLQSKTTGAPQYAVNGTLFNLKKGANFISKNEITGLTYDFYNNNFTQDFLQVGSYIYCIELQTSTPKGLVTIGKDCFLFGVTPMSPPLLRYPEDKSTITTPKPIFSWTPPQPVFLMNNVKYELNVVEVKEAQKPLEAILDNPSLLYDPFLNTTYSGFQNALFSLENNKTYAWRVKASNDQDAEIYSDTWSFTYHIDSVENIINNAPYTEAIKAGNLVGYLHQGTIKFTYYNMLADTMATVRILDMANAVPKTIWEETIQLQRGQNYILLKTENSIRLDAKKVYTIELLNSKGENWSYIGKPKYYR